MTTEEVNLADAEARYLETLAEQLQQRAKELRETSQEAEAARLVSKLEDLPFKPAQSGKCDWIEAGLVPDEVRALFDSKGEFRIEKHHFITTKDRNILRFKRKENPTANTKKEGVHE